MLQNLSSAAVVIDTLRVIEANEYGQEMPQSENTDQPMALRGRDTEQ